MLQVRLDPGLPAGRWACVRPLCGHDEQALVAGGGLAATELLDRLLVEVPGTCVGPGSAWQLSVCDRDRLLAGVYAATFSDRIDTEVPCDHCDEGTAVSFSLAAMVASSQPSNEGRTQLGIISGPDDGCVYELDDGIRFRLPNGHDQREVAGLDPERARVEILRRCVLDGSEADRRTVGDMPTEVWDRVEAAMAYLGPTVDHELMIACHECGEARAVRFDIQQYLLRALEQERRYLTQEIHYLACSYGWSQAEILGLSRDDRRAYVEFITAERAARRERTR
ncbi:hypothetical protein DB30_02514 [Enhygromyxa salina]|uniref:T4 bacteriophage base plate protein n=1 Tax=Enhygromyxa salina TaxID=215803 RepID=A0A0C2D3U1_9BACT|nr:hypothetical protein [Enhygromyxa salina]KIG17891.1 hypothetical protein DB30_02514 [Enhygromyxa salina]